MRKEIEAKEVSNAAMEQSLLDKISELETTMHELTESKISNENELTNTKSELNNLKSLQNSLQIQNNQYQTEISEERERNKMLSIQHSVYFLLLSFFILFII